MSIESIRREVAGVIEAARTEPDHKLHQRFHDLSNARSATHSQRVNLRADIEEMVVLRADIDAAISAMHERLREIDSEYDHQTRELAELDIRISTGR